MFKIIGGFIILFIGTCLMLGLPLSIVWTLLEWDYMSLLWICIIVTITIAIYGAEMKKR